METIKDEDIEKVTGGTTDSKVHTLYLMNLIGIGNPDPVISYYNEHESEIDESDKEKIKKRFKFKFGYDL